MYGVPPRGHLQGQTRDNSNMRFFTLKKTHRHVFLYNICCIYMSYGILFEGVCFALSYSTHIWNQFVILIDATTILFSMPVVRGIVVETSDMVGKDVEKTVKGPSMRLTIDFGCSFLKNAFYVAFSNIL